MLRATLLLAAAGICSGGVSATEIYRCTGLSGEPLFSQRPCAAGTVVSIPSSASPSDGPNAPASGLRASESAWLAQRERRAVPSRRRATRSVPAEEKAERQAFRCREKRRALHAAKAKLRRGYKPSQGEKLRRRRSAYEDYLATFCS